MTNAKRKEMPDKQRTEFNRRKKANKAKNKNAAREQAAQAQTTQSSRDNNAKPSSNSAPRKPAEAQVKPASPAPKPQPVAEEPHVPMNGFNAAEVEAMLNSCANEEVEHYVPDKPTPATNRKHASTLWQTLYTDEHCSRHHGERSGLLARAASSSDRATSKWGSSEGGREQEARRIVDGVEAV